eukprot:TRINITY_DN19557_c0_g1_i2.p1 TRINITY_DN19557_c0_g1~~TRINITY_DN19557_c0_g1_i2.p1  ORF type:complete len:466 (+),score=133.42 TRINITY_DN19557_c0_g1_i2:84-1400(+)
MPVAVAPPQSKKPMEHPATPWLPERANPSAVTLDGEIQAFVSLVSLSEDELQARSEAVREVHRAAKGAFPKCAAQVYGSLAVGLGVEHSVVDLALLRCGPLTDASARAAAAAAGTVRSFAFGDPNGAFAQIQTAAGVVLNVTYNAGEAPVAEQSVAVAKRWLARWPGIGGAHAVLRHVLDQTGCLDAVKGGLGSYALLVMLAHAAGASRVSAGASPGALLLYASEYYGETFDFARFRVFADSTHPLPRTAASHGPQMVVDDPCQLGNNLAAGCTKLFAIRAQLTYCASTLRRWQGDCLRPAGYRGRTPLSGLLSYQKQWSRAKARFGREAPASSPSPSPGSGRASPAVRSSDGLTESCSRSRSASPSPEGSACGSIAVSPTQGAGATHTVSFCDPDEAADGDAPPLLVDDEDDELIELEQHMARELRHAGPEPPGAAA